MSSHGSDYIKLALNRGAILIISSKAINNKKVHYVPDLENILLDFFMTIMILNRRNEIFWDNWHNSKTSIKHIWLIK